MTRARAVALVTIASMVACVDPEAPQTAFGAAQYGISDAAHGSNADPHFFFMPPVASTMPAPVGNFTAEYLPFTTVEICKTDAAGACGSTLRTYRSAGSNPMEQVRVDATRQFYLVYWNTGTGVDPAQPYRIRVLVGDIEVGHADVRVARTSAELAQIDRQRYAGVMWGTWLPIRFRLEEGAAGSGVIGPEGGLVQHASGASVTVPPGSFVQSTLVGIRISEPPPSIPALSQAFMLTISEAPGLPSAARLAQASDPPPGEIRLPLLTAVPGLEGVSVHAALDFSPFDYRALDFSLDVSGASITMQLPMVPFSRVTLVAASTADPDDCQDQYDLLDAPEDANGSAPGVPIIFIHGWQAAITRCAAWETEFDPASKGDSIFAYLDALGLAGAGRYMRYTYPTFRPIGEAAEKLAAELEQEFSDRDDVILIGHSMGGLVARAAVLQHRASDRVRRVITLGTPHNGADIARKRFWLDLRSAGPFVSVGLFLDKYVGWLVPGDLNTKGMNDLRPDSDFIVALNGLGSGALRGQFFTYAGRMTMTHFAGCPWGDFLCQAVGLGIQAYGEGNSDGIVSFESARWVTSGVTYHDVVGYDHFEMSEGAYGRPEGQRDPLLEEVARLVAEACCPPSVHAQDLGTLGGTSSGALAVNDRGQIVGFSQLANGESHAFLWEAGALQDLQTLGGSLSVALAINNHGQVVGNSTLANGVRHAFLWTRQTGMVDLGVPAGCQASTAVDINDAGHVLLSGSGCGLAPGVWVYDVNTGTQTAVASLGGTDTFATTITTLGHVYGLSEPCNNCSPRPFMWTPTAGPAQLAIPGLNNIASVASANAAGQVVGIRNFGFGPRPYFWDPAAPFDQTLCNYPGASSGEARDVSNVPYVAGSAIHAGGTFLDRRAFLCTPGEMPLSLEPLAGWIISTGEALNSGAHDVWLVGASRMAPPSTVTRATLWRVQK